MVKNFTYSQITKNHRYHSQFRGLLSLENHGPVRVQIKNSFESNKRIFVLLYLPPHHQLRLHYLCPLHITKCNTTLSISISSVTNLSCASSLYIASSFCLLFTFKSLSNLSSASLLGASLKKRLDLVHLRNFENQIVFLLQQ